MTYGALAPVRQSVLAWGRHAAWEAGDARREGAGQAGAAPATVRGETDPGAESAGHWS